MRPTKKQLAILGLALVLLPILYYLVMTNGVFIGRLPVLEAPQGPLGVTSSGGGASRGPFRVTLNFSEPPALNRTVAATITLENMHDRGGYANTTIELELFKRTSPYYYDRGFTAWRRVLWRGYIPPNGVVRAGTAVRIEEPGLYAVIAKTTSPGPIFFGTDVALLLNVTEGATAIGVEGFIEPEPRPPAIPYLIKMDLDGVPAENRPVNLRVTIASLMDVKNATFRIFLPEGYELVSGDLAWRGDLQKAMDEGEVRGLGIAQDKISETALQRIPEGKKVSMRATIRAKLIGNARIFVFPSQERPSTVDCDAQGLYRPHPEGGGWQAVSRGGCLYVRVYNETHGISSELALPPEPTPPKPPPPPEPPRTIPPGATPSPPIGR